MKLPRYDNPFGCDRLNSASDYRPDWDIAEMGWNISENIREAIRLVMESPEANSEVKINVLVGEAGTGKTQVFGRLRHQTGEEILFVSVQPREAKPEAVLGSIQWQLVEALFEPGTDGSSRLVRSFSLLLKESFEQYFDQLPPVIAVRADELRKQWKTDWRTLLEVLAPVTTLDPYQRLADSVAKRFPRLATNVVRALVLGLSPASDDVRRWLRGEGQSLSHNRLSALRLPETSPTSFELLHTAAVLLQRTRTPIVICVDQLDLMMKDESGESARRLADELVIWLHQIPNILLMLGALEDTWRTIQRGLAEKATRDRLQEQVLGRGQLSPDHAAQIVCKRMTSWTHWEEDVSPGSPFDLASVRNFVQQEKPTIRKFIEECREHFDDWLLTDQKEPIYLRRRNGKTLDVFFRELWDKEFQKIQGANPSPANLEEKDHWEGVLAAVNLARKQPKLSESWTVTSLSDSFLEPTTNDHRPGACLAIGASGNKKLAIAVTSKDGGQAFFRYVQALRNALAFVDVVGAVVVRPSGKLSVSENADSYIAYCKLEGSGKVRTFALDAERDTFHTLECLKQVLRQARGQEIVYENKALTEEECGKLILELGLLENLKLFQFLFANWTELEKLRPRVQPAAQPAAAKVAVAVAPAAAASVGGTSVPGPAVAVKPTPPPTPPPRPSHDEWANGLLTQVAEKLRNWNLPVRPLGFEMGPTFVRLKVMPGDQTNINHVFTRAEHLKLHLSLTSKPLIEAQPGYLSIDIQRRDRQPVELPPLLKERPDALQGKPAFPVGVDVSGKTHWLDLSDTANCHLLIAGTTGSGKSEFLKAIMAGLAASLTPQELQFVLIDPKQVTFNFRLHSPYLIGDIANNAEDALQLIEQTYNEMQRRYTLFKQLGKHHVGELEGAQALPRWVLIFDEFADLMADRDSKKELERLLKRLGGMARAAGIHLILGTQRTEASVVTPLLRSNLPGRISLQVISDRDSKLILDRPEAAYLLGKGDLFMKQGAGLVRLQSPFVPRAELEAFLRLH